MESGIVSWEEAYSTVNTKYNVQLELGLGLLHVTLQPFCYVSIINQFQDFVGLNF